MKSCLTIAVLAASAALVLPSTAAADWPVYGHDLANSRDAGSDGPAASEVGSLKQAWKFDSQNGDFTGTPVAAGGVLVAGTNLGTIYAIDAVTGKQRWSRDIGKPVNGSAALDLDAPGGPTAFVPVAQLGAPRLVALSLATGAVRWDVTLTKQDGADVFGSPTFWNGTVYIGTSGQGNDESTARGSVVALDEATGTFRWQTYVVPPGDDGGAVWATPAIDPATGRLYVGTGNAYHDPAADTTDAMIVLSTVNGGILGHFQSTPGDVWEADAPFGGPDYDFGASPNLMTAPDGRLLVGEGQKSGTYWALDAATMQPVWRTAAGPGSNADGGIDSSAYDGTRIYGSDAIDGQVFALGRGDGKELWNSVDSGPAQFGPVALGNGVLYNAGANGFLTARDPSSGAVLTKLPLGAPTFGGVSLVGRAVYVAVGIGPPSPAQPVPGVDTSSSDGNGSIVAFGDTSKSGAAPVGRSASRPAPSRPRLELSVTPRRVQPGRRETLRFRTRAGSRPVAGALIRLGERRARTDRRGLATLTVRLPREGSYTVRATRHGLAAGTATIQAGRSTGGDHSGNRGEPPAKPESFDGSCVFSGAVKFTPPMTTTPQHIAQHADAPGTCTGTFVDKHGGTHHYSGAPARDLADSAGDNVSCAFGVATGAGTLTFPDGEISFTMTEYRGGATPMIRFDGKDGGGSWMLVTPSQKSDPTAAVQACNGAGLAEFDLDGHLQTDQPIKG